jgi:AcrR family transcriptional regulator
VTNPARATPQPSSPAPSARKEQLLERAYRYVVAHGLTGMSLRPLAAAIGSSPRVLLFLFGSKEGLIRALLARARADELQLLARARPRRPAPGDPGGAAPLIRTTWRWLAAEPHQKLLTLWLEAYARSLTEPGGPWAGFARQTVEDWLSLLSTGEPSGQPADPASRSEQTLALAVLRGALLDLLATGDEPRVTAAIERYLKLAEHAQEPGQARRSGAGQQPAP